jgi:hypothetical protein
MRRWAGLVAAVVFTLLFAQWVAGDDAVGVVTVPRAFAPGEAVTVKVEVSAPKAYSDALLGLSVMDSYTVVLNASHSLGALGIGEHKSYEFPEKFVAPATLHGKYLTVVVFLGGDQSSFDFNFGGRLFVRQCKQAEGVKEPKAGRLTCVYKTPAQIVIEGTVNQPSPRPHP